MHQNMLVHASAMLLIKKHLASNHALHCDPCCIVWFLNVSSRHPKPSDGNPCFLPRKLYLAMSTVVQTPRKTYCTCKKTAHQQNHVSRSHFDDETHFLHVTQKYGMNAPDRSIANSCDRLRTLLCNRLRTQLIPQTPLINAMPKNDNIPFRHQYSHGFW